MGTLLVLVVIVLWLITIACSSRITWSLFYKREQWGKSGYLIDIFMDYWFSLVWVILRSNEKNLLKYNYVLFFTINRDVINRIIFQYKTFCFFTTNPFWCKQNRVPYDMPRFLHLHINTLLSKTPPDTTWPISSWYVSLGVFFIFLFGQSFFAIF